MDFRFIIKFIIKIVFKLRFRSIMEFVTFFLFGVYSDNPYPATYFSMQEVHGGIIFRAESKIGAHGFTIRAGVHETTSIPDGFPIPSGL